MKRMKRYFIIFYQNGSTIGWATLVTNGNHFNHKQAKYEISEARNKLRSDLQSKIETSDIVIINFKELSESDYYDFVEV